VTSQPYPTNMTMPRLATWTILLLLHIPALEAFAPIAPIGCGAAAALSRPSSSCLEAKKKRRRKQTAPAPESTDTVDFDNGNELPDFDLKEEMEEAAAATPRPMVSTNPDEITPAMMGSATTPVRSVKDLVSDRALEQKFEFGESQGGETLPDLVEMMKTSGSNGAVTSSSVVGGSEAPVVGKKKARQAERQAAALAREEEDVDPLDFLNSIPFLVDPEKGKVTYLKVVESGTWLAIFVLVGWELYINSPFFDRAGPIAPVVF